MAKQVTGQAKFQVPGGQATPAPPVGTSLGKFGVNLGQFVQAFNDRTKEYNGTPIPVIVTIYNDRSFDSGIAAEAGCWDRQRKWCSEQGKSWQGDFGPMQRDRREENGRPERTIDRSSRSHDRRNGQKHGH